MKKNDPLYKSRLEKLREELDIGIKQADNGLFAETILSQKTQTGIIEKLQAKINKLTNGIKIPDELKNKDLDDLLAEEFEEQFKVTKK